LFPNFLKRKLAQPEFSETKISASRGWIFWMRQYQSHEELVRIQNIDSLVAQNVPEFSEMKFSASRG
jgi:hypothetical protein